MVGYREAAMPTNIYMGPGNPDSGRHPVALYPELFPQLGRIILLKSRIYNSCNKFTILIHMTLEYKVSISRTTAKALASSGHDAFLSAHSRSTWPTGRRKHHKRDDRGCRPESITMVMDTEIIYPLSALATGEMPKFNLSSIQQPLGK